MILAFKMSLGNYLYTLGSSIEKKRRKKFLCNFRPYHSSIVAGLTKVGVPGVLWYTQYYAPAFIEYLALIQKFETYLHTSAGIRLTLKSHVLTKVVDFCTYINEPKLC